MISFKVQQMALLSDSLFYAHHNPHPQELCIELVNPTSSALTNIPLFKSLGHRGMKEVINRLTPAMYSPGG
jgi:hypothetical protein